MADSVRMGVVGAGSISVRGILPHLSQPDLAGRVTLAAVCDPVPGRAEAAAEKFGVGQGFTEYEELLARGDVDAVTIASPIAPVLSSIGYFLFAVRDVVLLTAEVFPGSALYEHLLLTCSTDFICTLFSYFCIQVFFQCHHNRIHHSVDLSIRQSFFFI